MGAGRSLNKSYRQASKLLALKMLPNGDWNIRGKIQVWVPVGSQFNQNSIKGLIAFALDEILAGAKMTVYNEVVLFLKKKTASRVNERSIVLAISPVLYLGA